MTSRTTHRSKWSSASCSLSAGTIGSPKRLPSEVGATLTARKSKAMSTTRCPTVMRTVSLTALNFAKQNAPPQPVREQLLGSGMLSSGSAPLIIFACPTPPKRMPPPSPQRAGKCFNGFMSQILYYLIRNLFAGLSGANLPCTGAGLRRIVYSSDEEDD